jgi:hypothetical protein
MAKKEMSQKNGLQFNGSKFAWSNSSTNNKADVPQASTSQPNKSQTHENVLHTQVNQKIPTQGPEKLTSQTPASNTAITGTHVAITATPNTHPNLGSMTIEQKLRLLQHAATNSQSTSNQNKQQLLTNHVPQNSRTTEAKDTKPQNSALQVVNTDTKQNLNQQNVEIQFENLNIAQSDFRTRRQYPSLATMQLILKQNETSSESEEEYVLSGSSSDSSDSDDDEDESYE